MLVAAFVLQMSFMMIDKSSYPGWVSRQSSAESVQVPKCPQNQASLMTMCCVIILRKYNEDDNTIINSSQTKLCSSLSLSANLSVASCCFRHFYSRQCSALPDKIQTCPTPFHHHTDNSDLVRSYETSAMLVALNCEKLCVRERWFLCHVTETGGPAPFYCHLRFIIIKIKDFYLRMVFSFRLNEKSTSRTTQKQNISLFKLLSFCSLLPRQMKKLWDEETKQIWKYLVCFENHISGAADWT